MTEKEKRSRGELYDANYNPEIGKELLECKDKCFRYNQIPPSHEEERHTAMEAILGKTGKQFTINAHSGAILAIILKLARISMPITDA